MQQYYGDACGLIYGNVQKTQISWENDDKTMDFGVRFFQTKLYIPYPSISHFTCWGHCRFFFVMALYSLIGEDDGRGLYDVEMSLSHSPEFG